jgi:hypothetical protein
MSDPIVDLDPLLYYLHEHGTGSWTQFAKAAKNLHSEADPFSIARGLSEHALVEFLWDGNKKWSVTPAVAVVYNRAGGRIALWGGTHRASSALREARIDCQIDIRRILRPGVTYTYRHVTAIDVPHASALRGIFPVVNSQKIVETLPSVEKLLLKAPVCDAPSTNARTSRYVYHFASSSMDEPTPFFKESPSLWKVGMQRYLFVRSDVIRQVPAWLGKWMLYAAERSETWAALYVRRDEVLALPFAPLIAPPYARALLLNGALEIAPTQFGTRCFSNVSEPLAFEVCSKLSIEPEIKESRHLEHG